MFKKIKTNLVFHPCFNVITFVTEVEILDGVLKIFTSNLNPYKIEKKTVTALQHCCDIVSNSYHIVPTLQRCVAVKIVLANRPVQHHLKVYGKTGNKIVQLVLQNCCKGDVTRGDSQRRFLGQHSVATLFRIVANRRCESSSVTSPS